MALTNMALKTKNWSHFGEEETVEKKGRRRRGEEEINQKGMETSLDHGIEWIYGNLRLGMVNSLSPNLGF